MLGILASVPQISQVRRVAADPVHKEMTLMETGWLQKANHEPLTAFLAYHVGLAGLRSGMASIRLWTQAFNSGCVRT